MAKTQQAKTEVATAAAPKSNAVVISDQLQADYEVLKKEGQNKSTTIRALFAKGYERGQIAKVMQIRYQHVRNVLITPVKRPVVKEHVAA